MAVDGEFAVHVTWLMTSETWSPSSVVIGGESFVLATVTVHPGKGIIDTDAIGRSNGSTTWTFTVDAVSLSFGTRKVTLPSPPCVASSELTVTCAEAAAANPTTPQTDSAHTTRTARSLRPMRPILSICQRQRPDPCHPPNRRVHATTPGGPGSGIVDAPARKFQARP